MGKTNKKNTGNPEKLHKVKQTNPFKPHNKKKTNWSKHKQSITGSLVENVVSIQEKHFSKKQKKKTRRFQSKLNNKESNVTQKLTNRGQSAFTVLKDDGKSTVEVDDKKSSPRNCPSAIQQKANTTVSCKIVSEKQNSSQSKAKGKLPQATQTSKGLVKSVKKANSENQGKSTVPVKTIKKKNRTGNKGSRKDLKPNLKRKQETSEVLIEETVASEENSISHKKGKRSEEAVDKIMNGSERTEQKMSEGVSSSTDIITVPSADSEQLNEALDSEVIDLISSESEMSDSDFSIVDLTVDDPGSEAVNFEPDESERELLENEVVSSDVVVQEVIAVERPELQNVGGRVKDVDRKNKAGKNAKGSTKNRDLGTPRFHALAAFDSQVLLVLPNPGVYCFLGKCFLKCLHGQAEVFGYQLTEQFQAFYSPACNSLLTVSTSEQQFNAPQKGANVEPPSKTKAKKKNKNKKTQTLVSISEPETITKIYSEWLLLPSDMDKLPKDNVCILLVRKMDSNICDYIATFKAFAKLWDNPDPPKQRAGEERDAQGVRLESVGLTYIPEQAVVARQMVSQQQLEVLQKWDKVLDSDKEPILMVVGGKNSGKSTLNRYLLNHTLNKIPEVCYLECDIGQTEFTPPGCVSLQVLSTPILGPPFTHQKLPKRCYYYGGLSASDNPNLYTECIRTCVQDYWNLQQKHESKLPLVVNTMGWIEDLGLELLISLIRMTLPSLLVQINFRNPKMNAEPLTPEFVNDRKGWVGHSRFYRSSDLPGLQGTSSHGLVSLDSPASDVRRKDQWKPFELRDLAMISYMSSVLSRDSSLTLETPYGVPWASIAISICRKGVPKQEWIAAINATMVGLAEADLSQAKKDSEEEPYFFDDTPVCPCVGIGMVRAIDVRNKMIYITTPLSLVDLVRVNTIIRGSSNIPQQIFTEQITKEEREIPYVTRITPTVASKNPRQRKHIPSKSRKRATAEATSTE